MQLGIVSRKEQRDLYWATGIWALPWDGDGVLSPRCWVSNSPLYRTVAQGLHAQGIAELSSRRSEFEAAPSLEKCVAEAVYEELRQEVLPLAPSRLNCLFAAEDAIAAIEFLRTYGPPPRFDASGMSESGAIPVSTADGAWVALDMHLFCLAAVSDRVEQNRQLLDALRDKAACYWSGELSPDPFAEILCEKLWRWTDFIGAQGAPAEFAVWANQRRCHRF
jgi:hypothetical protein